MQALDIIIEDERWQMIPFADLATRAIRATLTTLALDPGLCEVSLLACDDAKITRLNGDFREKSQPTNVLSWPAEERAAEKPGARPAPPRPGFDGMIELGDIAISYDTCMAEAQAAGAQISAHTTHLIVHGTLHLLGYDHIRDADGDLMEAVEIEILGKLGFDSPY